MTHDTMAQDTNNRFFSMMAEPVVPAGLLAATLCRIRNEQFRAANRRQLAILMAVTVLALVGIAYFGRTAIKDLYRSGFLDFISLAIAEPAVLVQSGSSFLMSLIESLPGLSLLLPLAVVLAYLETFRLIAGHFNLPTPAKC